MSMNATDTKGPRPYHVGRMKFPKQADYESSARVFAERLKAKGFTVDFQPPSVWTEPRYPGDTILIVHLVKGDELGDVRVQWYGNGLTAQPDDKLKVGSFTPGYDECSPGDTPKFWPDKSEWFNDRDAASRQLVQYLIAAFRDGWRLMG